MSISIGDLLKKVVASYDASAQTLTVPSDGYGEKNIADVLGTWVDTSLILNSVKSVPVVSNNLITISGTSSFLNSSVQTSTIVVGVSSGDGVAAPTGTPFLIYEFPLPFVTGDQWAFSTSFPALKDSSLDEIEYQQSGFWLSSVKKAAAAKTPELKTGLNFQSLYAVPATDYPKLKAVIGVCLGTGSLKLSGNISILQGSINDLDTLVPGFDLVSETNSLAFGTVVTLPMTFSAECRLAKAGDPFPLNTAYPLIALNSIIKINSLPDIGIKAELNGLGNLVTLISDLGGLQKVGLAALQKFLAGIDLTSSFSSLFSIGNDVELKKIKLFIDLTLLEQKPTEALVAMSADVGTVAGKTWDIVTGYIELDTIDFSFMLNYPTTTPSLAVIVDGDFTFGENVKMVASAAFPEPSFGLSSLTSFSLSKLITHFIPEVTHFPDVICKNLQITATPNKGPYSLNTAITSDWAITAGPVSIKLTEADIDLNYDSGTTTGLLQASSSITPAGGGSAITTNVQWNLPGDFTLSGNFPDINLTALAKDMAGVVDLSLPSGFPSIALTNADLMLVVNKGNGASGSVYDFSLSANFDFDSTSLGVVFEVRKDAKAFGFVSGLWTTDWAWSPAKQWPEIFGSLLSGITFSHSGLVVSSIDNAEVDLKNAPVSIPKTVGKGMTFFSSIGFGSSVLKFLDIFFPNADGIQVYGLFADPLSNSKIVGKIGSPSSTSKYSFDGLQFTANFAALSFSLQTGVTFDFHQIAGANAGKEVTIDFVGGGTIALEPPSFLVYFALKAKSDLSLVEQPLVDEPKPPQGHGWVDPLGVEGLTIQNFWGEIGVKEDLPTFGFGGDITIGPSGADQILLELDIEVEVVGEVPVVDVFIFNIATASGKEVSLVGLIKEFTSLDLGKVPILNGIAFKDFSLYLVNSPGGWTNPATQVHYPASFATSGDLYFYGLEAVFDISIIYTQGIDASGYVKQAIDLGNGLLKISDAKDDGKGPFGSINTTDLTSGKPYLTLSGKIVLLDISDTFEASISASAFSFFMDLKNPIYTEKLTCQYSDGTKFSGSVAISVGIKCTPSFPIIGKLHIDDSVTGSLSVAIDGDSFKASVNGSFSWQGHSISLAHIDISGSFSKFSELAAAIESYVVSKVEELFSDVLSDVENYIKAIINGAITDGEFIVNVLHGHYAVTNIEDLLVDMGKILEKGIHLSGTTDFHLDLGLPTIPSYHLHADLGKHIDEHGDIIFGIGAHADAGLSATFGTPSIPLKLIDIGDKTHLDMSSTQVHADASVPFSQREHIDIGIAGGSVGVEGDVGFSGGVSITDFDASFHPHVNVKGHGSIHGDVKVIGVHGDVSALHIDETL